MKVENKTSLDEQVKKLRREADAVRWGVQIVDDSKFRNHRSVCFIFEVYTVLLFVAFLAFGGIVAWQEYHFSENGLSSLFRGCEQGVVEFDNLVYYEDNGYTVMDCSNRAMSLKEHLNVD